MSGKKKPILSLSDSPVIEKKTGTDSILMIILKGRWKTQTIHLVDSDLRQLQSASAFKVIIDVSGVTALDTGGAWLIKRLEHHFVQKGVSVSLKGAQAKWVFLLKSVSHVMERFDLGAASVKRSPLSMFFERVGRNVIGTSQDFIMAMNILGSIIHGTSLKSGRHRSLNFRTVITQIDRMGVRAVPIIVLMSFIIGAIIAQQGAFQLRYFGAEIFVVDLVGILVFRELGVLLTAIMIAGRSGSAITAEIGSMKMREEIDALKVIGLDPIRVLIFPRLVALAVILPFLTIIADISAFVGAAIVANVYSNIPTDAFLSRLNGVVWLSTYFAGIVKAPFMAFIIGIIASVEAMKVGGNAESLSAHVTSSVVKSIFIVIIVDGFFAIFYASINF
ncbi:MAG: Permease [Candidatus Tokpelaia sp. JSC189]|nr:MAG: Permease [Candidatus Tokpelaia sp. JSC189]